MIREFKLPDDTVTMFMVYNKRFLSQVIGGEEQGIPVAIGHVTPEGPAEGLLQIYDEIRSVNGNFVICLSLLNDIVS